MMKLRLKSEEDSFFNDYDVRRFVKICADRGYEVSFTDAGKAWERFSDRDMCAVWMLPPSDDEEVFRDLMRHLVKEEDDL